MLSLPTLGPSFRKPTLVELQCMPTRWCLGQLFSWESAWIRTGLSTVSAATYPRSIGGPKGPPLGPISFIFMQFSAKILPNNSFSHQIQELATPPPHPIQGNPGSVTGQYQHERSSVSTMTYPRRDWEFHSVFNYCIPYLLTDLLLVRELASFVIRRWCCFKHSSLSLEYATN